LIPEQEDGGRGLDGAVGSDVCHGSMMIAHLGRWQAPPEPILQAAGSGSAPNSASVSSCRSSRSRR
jgi:hypothetical protein